jgi:hypothetical protein
MLPKTQQDLMRMLLPKEPDVGTIEPISPLEFQEAQRQQLSSDPVLANIQKLGRAAKSFIVPETPIDSLMAAPPLKAGKGLLKTTEYLYTPTFKNKQLVEKNFTERLQSGYKTPQQMHDAAVRLNPAFQQEVGDIAKNLGLEKAPKFIDKNGKKFDVEVKTLDSLVDKRLRGKEISEITDPIRTRIFVNRPENADDVVAQLRKKYDVLDEGEKLIKSTGFQARNVNVAYKAPNGESIIGEIQLISKPMADATAKTHELYSQERSLRKAFLKNNPNATDIPARIRNKEIELRKMQKDIFDEARKQMDDSFLEKVVTIK